MRRLAVALLLGAASVAGFAPFYLFPLPVVALAGVLLMLERERSARTGLRLGFAYGIGQFVTGVSWVYVSLHDFGAMPAPAAVAVTLLFCAYLALFPAVAFAAAGTVGNAAARRLLTFPGAWIVTEWMRGWLFTGFPWLALGYSQAPTSPLAGFAPLAGVYAVGLATALTAGLVVHAFGRKGRRPAWRPLLLVAVLCTGGAGLRSVEWTEPVGEPIRVALLQGNVPQSLKWQPEQIVKTLNLYQSMIRASKADLIVLPETAVPLFLQQVPVEFLESVERHARAIDADVLLGLPERGAGRAYFNSVVSLGASSTQTYRKSHLVPFGEFIPLRPLLAPIVESLAIPLTDFSRGAITQRPLAVAGQRVAVNICYEDAFGGEIIRQLPEATLLVNVSNVAWFGRSIAPMQHLQIAQMRALESGRTMLRATNTGMTAVVDERGHIVTMAETFERRSVQAEVRGRTGATPFVQFGNAPAVIVAACALLASLVARSRLKPE